MLWLPLEEGGQGGDEVVGDGRNLLELHIQLKIGQGLKANKEHVGTEGHKKK